MNNRTRPPAQMWMVEIKRHPVKPRWIVPARTATVPSPTGDFACKQVIRWAHADVGIPPWRPCVRESLIHTTATPVGEASVTTIATRTPSGQLELFGRQAA